MLAAIDFLQMNPHTIILATCVCYSAAVPIVAAANSRYATPNCRFLAHPISLSAEGKSSTGEVIAEAKEMRRLENRYLDIMVKHTKKSKKFWKDLMDAHSYFSAADAKRWGLIDKIIRA